MRAVDTFSYGDYNWEAVNGSEANVMEGNWMIRKIIIIAVLAALGYGVYYGLNSSDFFGTRGKERKTFEDVEGSLFD